MIKPVIDLARSIKKIGAGDLTEPIDDSADDEIGELARVFNRTFTDLKASRKSLEDYGRTLEKRVEERMAELSRMNRLMMGRELRVIELKNELEELKKKSGGIHSSEKTS